MSAPFRSALVAATALPLLLAGACDRPAAPPPAQAATPLAALPMTDAPAPTSGDAPRASALPAAAPLRVARVRDPGQDYAYLDRAYGYGYGFGDSPPDYTFGYEGVDPYAWRGDDGAYRVAEPLGEGRYRFYYFEPGAGRPFLIRDPDYAYGYSDGALAAVYGPGGEVVPYADYGPRLGLAAALLTRAAGLYDASRDRSARRAVSRADWERRQGAFSAQRAAWSAAQARNAQWQAYHAAHEAQYAAHFGPERERREADAARFAQRTGDPAAARRDWAAAGRAAPTRDGPGPARGPSPAAGPDVGPVDHAGGPAPGEGARFRRGREAEGPGPQAPRLADAPGAPGRGRDPVEPARRGPEHDPGASPHGGERRGPATGPTPGAEARRPGGAGGVRDASERPARPAERAEHGGAEQGVAPSPAHAGRGSANDVRPDHRGGGAPGAERRGPGRDGGEARHAAAPRPAAAPAGGDRGGGPSGPHAGGAGREAGAPHGGSQGAGPHGDGAPGGAAPGGGHGGQPGGPGGGDHGGPPRHP